MPVTSNAVIRQAEAWLGYNEENGSFREIIDVYNSAQPLPRGYAVQYSDEWCATFVSAVAIAAGATDIIPPECGCPEMVRLFDLLGEWIEDDNIVPVPGDVIFYDWQDSGAGDNIGTPDHVGIVHHVENGVIHVIEGNRHQAVGWREIPVGGQYIRGFGAPNYGVADTLDYTTIAREVIAGKWGNGAERVERLSAAGYDAALVQQTVNELLRTDDSGKTAVDVVAREVIAGKWGNGAQRRERLTAAGYNYAEVQDTVNAMLRGDA